MADNLVIVESPAKAKTIEKYLGKGFKVKATLGHVRDLPKKDLAVDVEHDFKPVYIVAKEKSKVINDLKKAIPKDGTVYLAPDPDREGEAIAWHIAQALDLIEEDGSKKHPRSKTDVRRIVFNEITEGAIQEAIKKPRDIDLDLVDAQQARRVLDRLVGYKLSPLLWTKIRYGLSAGRVQSVAVRLVVERERARDAFKPEEYWTITANLLDDDKTVIIFNLVKKKGKKYAPKSAEEAKKVESAVEKEKWIISNVERQEQKKYPKPPFTTSTLQQSANNSLGYPAKKTMSVAQQLYQGINIKGKGHTALITYMRTDSFNLSKQAQDKIRGHIKSEYGDSYLPEKAIMYKSRAKNTQEAHEAIRPTDVSVTPESVKAGLSNDQYRLYKLIWDRAVASQMNPAVYDRITADIDVADYTFRATAQKVKFPGYTKVWKSKSGDEEEVNNFIETPVEKDQELKLKNLDLLQHFTKPPARYTDASLVKELEKYGIGRPSTYAPTLSTIQARSYVGKEGRYFFPEDTGYVVNDLLVKHFPEIVDYDFTAEMEEKLDKIAEGKEEWVPVIRDFFMPFEKQIVVKNKEIKKEDVVVLGKSDEKCPECGKPMIIKLGKYGRFLSCSDFPECKGMRSLEEEGESEVLDGDKYLVPEKCPECGAEMQLKRGKYGQFWACTNYPKCKGAMPLMLKEKCPECKHNLVERKGRWGKTFIGCSNYPKCKFIKKAAPKEEKDEAVEADEAEEDKD